MWVLCKCCVCVCMCVCVCDGVLVCVCVVGVPVCDVCVEFGVHGVFVVFVNVIPIQWTSALHCGGMGWT